MIHYPAWLRPGDTIAVTSPSSGVEGFGAKRVEFCVAWLRDRGYRVVIGDCMDGSGLTSAPAKRRAAELTAMLCDPDVRCVLPPWGGETAIDLVDLLDWSALAEAEPTWLVGWSDISTLLVPITTRLGWATLHGDNLVDTPLQEPPGLLKWTELVGGPGPHVQRDSGIVGDWIRFEDDHQATRWREVGRGSWRLHGARTLIAQGRLIGGCIETVANLAGTPYGDVASFAQRHAGEGTIVYLEACEDDAPTICRNLHGLRLAGWFDHAQAIMIGRTNAKDDPDLTQEEAVLDALGRLDIPIVFDVEIGHVPPHLPLINGALATVTVRPGLHRIEQILG